MTMKDKITKSLGEVPESKNGIYFHIFKGCGYKKWIFS